MAVTLPLKEMSLEEKFLTIETVWNDIVNNSPEFPSPKWHGEILKEREAKIKSGEEQTIAWEKAKSLLRKALK